MDEQYTFTLFANNPLTIAIDDKNIYKIDNSNTFYATITTNLPEVMVDIIQDDQPQMYLLKAISEHGKKEKEYTIIKRDAYQYDVYFHMPPKQNSQKEVAFSHQDNSTSFVITKGAYFECCYFDHYVPCDYCYFEECDLFQCNHLGNYYYLICSKPDYNFMIVVDTTQKHIVYCHEVDEYQFTNDSITLLYNMDDYYHHAKVTKFNSTSYEEYYVFTDRKVDDIKEETLLPQVFLECVACEDYTHALALLSKDLKPTSEHLKQYFGKIDDIYYAGTIQNKVSYIVRSGNHFYRHEFVITSNKITNIE